MVAWVVVCVVSVVVCWVVVWSVVVCVVDVSVNVSVVFAGAFSTGVFGCVEAFCELRSGAPCSCLTRAAKRKKSHSRQD